MAIVFFAGSMFGQKSKMLIDYIDAAERDKVQKIVFKPTIDTRDGLFVKSRVYEKQIKAHPWNDKDKYRRLKFLEILTMFEIKEIFFDEVHFLNPGDMKFIVERCRSQNINLYMSGLLTDFRNNDFPSTRWLWQICDSKRFFYGNCNKCQKPEAVWNILVDKDGNRVTFGNSITVGDSDKYIVLCNKCYEIGLQN